MNKKPQFYIVAASALPEVFIKVAEVKRLLNTGAASTVHQATQMMGISRSAFYKYRDAIMPLDKTTVGRVVTLQFMLHDEPGALSNILTAFARWDANIMTINSIVPTNGCALVTITAETSNIEISLEELLAHLSEMPGVIKAEIVGG
jgi:chorismate mutase